MSGLMKRFLPVVLFCVAAHAESHLHKIFRATQAALLAGQSLDCASSWGKYELNPMLRSADGRFGGRGLSFKLGIAAGSLLAERLIVRRYPKAETFLIPLNLAGSGLFVGQAVHNWRVKP
jgi:hypothetical protein